MWKTRDSRRKRLEAVLSGTADAMATVDRIREPWGMRTPYGPGQPWPTRVDSYLADGLTDDDVDTWVQSASILHSNGDGLDIAVKDGRIAGVRGRAAHPQVPPRRPLI